MGRTYDRKTFENWAVRRILGPVKDGVTGG
jgi:hypothetical protein